MEKVKKEPLKTRDPYKYYRNAYIGCQSAEWTAIVAPLILVFAVKWNEYFDFANNESGAVRLTIGCVLAIVCGVLFVYKKMRHQEKTEKKVTMLTYVLGLAVAWVFVWLCGAIIDDLFLILSCELAGAITAYGIDFATQEMRRKQMLYRDAKEKLEAEEVARRIKNEADKKRRAVD